MMAARSLGTLTLDLVAKIGGFEQGLDKAARKAKKSSDDINKSLSTIGKAAAGAAAVAVGAIGASIVSLANQAIDAADKLGELSEKTGISVESLSRLGYAAKLSGSDLDSLASALPKFAKNITEAAAGTKAQAEAFAAIGVSVTDAEGQVKSIDTLLSEVADKFAGYEDGANKAALAQEFFGKSGSDLIPFLNNGAEGIARLSQESDNLGNTISGNTAKAAGEFNDNLDRLKTLATGFANVLISEVLPTLNALTGQLDGSTSSTDGLKAAVDAVLFPFRALAEEVILLNDLFESFAITVSATARAIGQAASGEFAQAYQTLVDANAQIEQNTSDTANRIEVLWGRSGERIREEARANLNDMGIQWLGLADTVINANNKINQAVGAGTVLLPGATGQTPRRQAPITGRAPAARSLGASVSRERSSALSEEVSKEKELNALLLEHRERITGLSEEYYREQESLADLARLRDENLISIEAYNAAVANTGKELGATDEQVAEAQKGIAEFSDSFRAGAEGLFEDFLTSSDRSFSGVLAGFGNLIQQLLLKALAANLTEALFGSGAGGAAGGAGGLFGEAAGAIAGALGFDGGGYTGYGTRTGGLDGKGGFMAMLHPNETVVDHTRGQTTGGRSLSQTFNISTPDANSFMMSQRQVARRAKMGLATA